MDVVPVRKGVLQESDDRVDVVLALLADVFKDESESFETSVPDVKLGRAVFVENGGDTGEGTTSLGDDG
jgi:hypothetical protein